MRKSENASIARLLPCKSVSATLADVADQFRFSLNRPLSLDEKGRQGFEADGQAVLADMQNVFAGNVDWSLESIPDAIKAYAAEKELKLGKVFQPLRTQP